MPDLTECLQLLAALIPLGDEVEDHIHDVEHYAGYSEEQKDLVGLSLWEG